MEKLTPFIRPKADDKDVDQFDHDFMDFAISRFISGESCASRTLAILDYIICMDNLEWMEVVDEMYWARDEIKRLERERVYKE